MIKPKKQSSWRTNVCAVITTVGYSFSQTDNATLQLIGQFLIPIGTVCGLFFAKDKQIED